MWKVMATSMDLRPPLFWNVSEKEQSNARRQGDPQQLNVQIGIAETNGDLKWLVDVIASEFAFRRANGKIDGAVGFLKAVKPSDPRITKIESVDVYGDRAVVTCLVTMGDRSFHNVRLLIRQD